VYFDQAENGMWVRAALIAHMFAVDDEIIKR
jgi:aspartate carbamoyltransferase catalytic subunit